MSQLASESPGSREVSNAVSAQTLPVFNAAKASDFVWQWGQFLDHDITLTPLADPAEGRLLMYNTAGLENDGGSDRADLFISDVRGSPDKN